MNRHPYINLAIDLVTPLHFLKWKIAVVGIGFAFLVSLRPLMDPNDDFAVSRTFVERMTPISYLLAIATVCMFVFGFIHCWRKSNRQLPLQDSAVGMMLGIGTEQPSILAQRIFPSVRPTQQFEAYEEEVTPAAEPAPRYEFVQQRPAVSTEDHGSYTVVDRRRFGHEVD